MRRYTNAVAWLSLSLNLNLNLNLSPNLSLSLNHKFSLSSNLNHKLSLSSNLNRPHSPPMKRRAITTARFDLDLLPRGRLPVRMSRILSNFRKGARVSPMSSFLWVLLSRLYTL